MKLDGRTLNRQALETIRRMAVKRVADGESPSAVIQSYGFCRTTIYKWLREARAGGEEALRARRGTGRKPLLTPAEKKRVGRWINGKNPRQHGFDFGLWTRNIVKDLIVEKLGVELSLPTVGRLLGELGITPQKPLRRAYERDPVAVEKWKQERFPALRLRAQERGADIFFLDEAGIRSDAPPGRTWGLRGKTPVVPTSGQRQSINAISAVNSRGAFWYATYKGKLDGPTFVKFLRDFLRTRRRPVFLVVDGHPSHRAAIVANYVRSTAGRLELHFLPGYAPDLNPDEFVWNQVKTHGLCKRPLHRNESLEMRLIMDLEQIKFDRKLVRSFFCAKSVAYIMN
jgi:transposase